MKRRIGDCTLYLGDCSEIVPGLKHVCAVVTDPPYGIRADENPVRGKSKHHVCNFDRERPPRALFDMLREVSDEQIIWGGNYFADLLPPSMRWLVWDKLQGKFSLADCELAWTSLDGAARMFRQSRGRANSVDNKTHPTQKSLDLMVWCIKEFLPDVDVVLDPFMGSGTTGVACVKLGKRFVGIEIDERYFEEACGRIQDEYGQRRFV